MLASTIPPPGTTVLHADQAHLLQDVALGIAAGVVLVAAYLAVLRWVTDSGRTRESRSGRETR